MFFAHYHNSVVHRYAIYIDVDNVNISELIEDELAQENIVFENLDTSTKELLLETSFVVTIGDKVEAKYFIEPGSE